MRFIINKKLKKSKLLNCSYRQMGFTLIEMLVYLGIMVVITITLVQSFIIVLKSNRFSFSDYVLRNSGYSIMENIIRETRFSKNVSYDSNTLQLIQSDGNVVIFFKDADGRLKLSEGITTQTDRGFLNSKGTKVINLFYNIINTGKSKALKINLVLETEIGGQNRSENFYSTIILRNSY